MMKFISIYFYWAMGYWAGILHRPTLILWLTLGIFIGLLIERIR